MNREFLEAMYIGERKSIPDIAAATGMAISTARRALIRFEIPLRSKAEGTRAAAYKTGDKLRGRKRNIDAEWREKLNAGIRKSARVINAKGTRISTNGYHEFTTGSNEGRSVHIVLMEEKIGRRLAPNEVVHHIDHDKLNNEISNLQLMTRAAHTSLHRRERNGKHQ